MELIEFLLSLIYPGRKKDAPDDGAAVETIKDVVTTPVPVTPPPYVPTPTPVVPIQEPKESHYHWIIDCGHGRLTKGKRSPVLPEGGQLIEYQFTGAVGREVSKLLTELNISHSLIPEDQEVVGNDLEYRVKFANNFVTNKQKILVSIHGNAGPVPNPETDWSTNFSGIEVWHFTPSEKSKQLATIFQKALVSELGWNNRGIKSKTSGQFYILKHSKMPACLTENGFYNSLTDIRRMLQPEIQKRIAKAHVDAILLIEKDHLI